MKSPFLATLASPLASLAGVLVCNADYIVDRDLGILSEGDTLTSGTTAETIIDVGPPPITVGGRNNAEIVAGVDLDPTGNWGTEFVIQFTLAEPATLTVLKEVEFTAGDPDFFILDSLATEVDPANQKVTAQNGLWGAFFDGAPPLSETLVLRDGTYYLVVESWSGNDGLLNPTDADFSLTLNVQHNIVVPDDLAVDLGHVGREGDPLTFDTTGSDYDTQIGIFDFFGEIVLQNDDANNGSQSEILIPQGLDEGEYFLVVAGAGANFQPGPFTTVGGAVGESILNYPTSPHLPASMGMQRARTTAGSEIKETQWFLFSVSGPAPTNVVDLGKLANADEGFDIHTLGSGFDTELGVYDEFGYLLAFNDDDNPNAGVFQSFLGFNFGLPEGNWFVFLGGWDHSVLDGFRVGPINRTEGGTYELSHPLGFVPGVLNPDEHHWFSFQIGDPGANPSSGISITSIDFNPVSKEFTVAWDSVLAGPFSIFMGTDADLQALQSPGAILPVPAAIGVISSPVTVQVPDGGIQGAPKVFLQVVEDAP